MPYIFDEWAADQAGGATRVRRPRRACVRLGTLGALRRGLWESSENDRARLAEFARFHGCSRPTTRWHGPSWRRARVLVTSRLETIEAIAVALLEQGTVKGEELEAIILGPS